MDHNFITVSDWLLVTATLTGPVIAVQAQKWVERIQARRHRQLSLFQTLMATRAIRAGSGQHVEALNLIELYFDGNTQKEKAVREAWALYLDFLNIRLPANVSNDAANSHLEKGTDLLIDLLKAMGDSLKYDFDKVKLKRGVYYPQGHADESLALRTIREGLVKLVNGQNPLKMEVVGFPFSEAASVKQDEVQTALLKMLSGESPLQVKASA